MTRSILSMEDYIVPEGNAFTLIRNGKYNSQEPKGRILKAIHVVLSFRRICHSIKIEFLI